MIKQCDYDGCNCTNVEAYIHTGSTVRNLQYFCAKHFKRMKDVYHSAINPLDVHKHETENEKLVKIYLKYTVNKDIIDKFMHSTPIYSINTEMALIDFIQLIGLTRSRGESNRYIKMHNVKINGTIVPYPHDTFKFNQSYIVMFNNIDVILLRCSDDEHDNGHTYAKMDHVLKLKNDNMLFEHKSDVYYYIEDIISEVYDIQFDDISKIDGPLDRIGYVRDFILELDSREFNTVAIGIYIDDAIDDAGDRKKMKASIADGVYLNDNYIDMFDMFTSLDFLKHVFAAKK